LILRYDGPLCKLCGFNCNLRHYDKMWGQLTSAIEVGSDVAGFKNRAFLHKPMTGWFGFVYALQARGLTRVVRCAQVEQPKSGGDKQEL